MSSTPNERIRDARVRQGLQPMEVAERLGLPPAHYRDLEDFEDEAWTTISLGQLGKLAEMLKVTPLFLLEGDADAINEADDAMPQSLSVVEFSTAVRKAVDASGGDVDAWGEMAGWDVAPLLQDPMQTWQLDADGLKDISEAAGVDWRHVLRGLDER